MSEAIQWGLVGHGTIGAEVFRQVSQPEVAERMGLCPLPSFVIRRGGLYVPHEGDYMAINQSNVPENLLSDTEQIRHGVTFIALPSSDDGELARQYIYHELEGGQAVVTAEKGALANDFKGLKWNSNNFEYLGINAAVGGGTRMIEQLRTYCADPQNVRQIHVVCNGTLNAIFSSIAPLQGAGMSLGQAVEHAVQLGYAEPGAKSPKDVIRGEAEGDIPKKAAILFNALGLSPDHVLRWQDLRFKLSDKVIGRAVEEANERRFIVSFYSDEHVAEYGKAAEDDIIDGFRYKLKGSGWTIVGGFRNIHRNPLFDTLAAMSGPFNGFVIGLGPNESDGIYTGTGPGAGPRATVNAMLDDWARIRDNS